ncbi:MAG: cytochrome C biogenesis protein [Deltaproteobacteria bacterium]|nr:MAG: cytochrome C biogenesis protein [Deltaproteobacteria bacterium]
MNLQVLASQSMENLAVYLHLSYGLAAGMVSAVNPCGFAMLPVYLSLYLGANDKTFGSQSILLRIFKALMVTFIVTSGFAVVFGAVGGLIMAGGSFIEEYIPWFVLVVGGLMILLGCWLLTGKHFSLPLLLKLAQKIGDPRDMSIWSFFLFGITFGITSMSCTLPIFLAVVGSSFTSQNWQEGLGQFFSFIAGVFLVLLILTLGIALVKKAQVTGRMKKIFPFIHLISAFFLLAAGGYIVWHQWRVLFH